MARRTVKAHFNRLSYDLQLLAVSSESNSQPFSIGGNYVREQRYGNRVPSEREQRVIELVAQGLKNREVADAIGTTEHVVKNYLRIIYDKLGLWEPGRTGPSGTKPADRKSRRTPEALESWEQIFSISISRARAVVISALSRTI